MQTFSNYKILLGQCMRKIKAFLTTDRTVDWLAFGKKLSGYLVSNRTNHDFHRPPRWGFFLNRIKPLWVVSAIRNALVLGVVVILTYTYLAIQRLPKLEDADQAMNIYQVQDIQKAAKLFGHKEVDLSKVQLTGLMRQEVSLIGYAIFEVEGKNTGAIAVGETFDKGYFLKSIAIDSVEIVFQGKQYQISMITKRF